MSEISDKVTAIYNKLPTNYIMGSGVVTDKDDEIDAILLDTGTTIPATLATIVANTGKVLNVYPSSITGTKPNIIGGTAIGVEDEKI